ncbi:MAG TPA: hypothetical protein VFG08_06125 [Candidatus Polarisedimenticolia bacterium]|nr:hypothetical protein [Candidatus Polarisedimenticolia bacterium]
MNRAGLYRGFVWSFIVFALAMAPAVAQDPLGTLRTYTGPKPIREGLLGSAVIVGSCLSPHSVPVGLTWDGSHLWVAEHFTRRAYRIDPANCSVVFSFALPGTFPGGLAWDGTHLWHADSNGDIYYKIDPSNGSVVSSFASPGGFPTGLTVHGGGLWGADVGCLNSACADNIYLTDTLGALQDTFAPPAAFPTGLASDGLNIWHSDNNSDLIYKIDPSDFSVLDSFPAPGTFSNDLAWDGRFLWVAEAQGERLYKLDVGTPLTPRSQGFWGHQCSDNGFRQYTAAEMDGLLSEVEVQSDAFSECAEATCELFADVGPQNDMREKTLIQLLAAWLNIVTDRLPLDAPIDLGGLSSAATVGEAIAEAESVVCDANAKRGDLETAKDVIESLVVVDNDFDLGANSTIVPVLSGTSRTLTVGLINMGSATTSYDLSVSGKWPVSVSPLRVSGLAPKGVALITITSEAPSLSTAGDLSVVQLTARDLAPQVSVQRDLSLIFQVPGSGGGGSKRILKPE